MNWKVPAHWQKSLQRLDSPDGLVVVLLALPMDVARVSVVVAAPRSKLVLPNLRMMTLIGQLCQHNRLLLHVGRDPDCVAVVIICCLLRQLISPGVISRQPYLCIGTLFCEARDHLIQYLPEKHLFAQSLLFLLLCLPFPLQPETL